MSGKSRAGISDSITVTLNGVDQEPEEDVEKVPKEDAADLDEG